MYERQNVPRIYPNGFKYLGIHLALNKTGKLGRYDVEHRGSLQLITEEPAERSDA